tara:strand:+ start:1160 stop:1957 length:798 start_codon:yes stop_codon:yes gene_type:complete
MKMVITFIKNKLRASHAAVKTALSWVNYAVIFTLPPRIKGNPVNPSNATLFYIHDPMCSWCWGFRPVWQQLEEQLRDTVNIVYIVGGLAADSDQPMPTGMQQALEATWQRIQQQIPGTEFNYDFWRPDSNTQPRRSTYASCRAVLAAKIQDPTLEHEMILGIQQAYYLSAKNPSNIDALKDVATSIGLQPEQFRHDMASETVEMQLQEQLQLARRLSAQGFPSLVLSEGSNEGGNKGDRLHAIPLDYNNSHTMQQAIVNITGPAE